MPLRSSEIEMSEINTTRDELKITKEKWLSNLTDFFQL